jgi:putative membrane protein insertion efficiency factor
MAAGLIMVLPGMVCAAGMNGPPPSPSSRIRPTAAEVSAASPQPLLGAIRLFQKYISPADGARCQFAPTCSAFGHRAIGERGPWLGLLMTADRLMRCSYWTDATRYPHLPNGRLADPVAANLGGG